MNTPETCPRFDACGANLCPLDSQWRKRSHLKSEPVCSLMMDAAKAGGPERLHEKSSAIAEAVLTASPLIALEHPDIARRLTRAAKSGSRSAQAHVAREGLPGIA